MWRTCFLGHRVNSHRHTDQRLGCQGRPRRGLNTRKDIDSTLIQSRLRMVGDIRDCFLTFGITKWIYPRSLLSPWLQQAIHGGDFTCLVFLRCSVDSWSKLRRGNATLLPEHVTQRRGEPKREDRGLWWVLSSVSIDLNLKRVCHSVWLCSVGISVFNLLQWKGKFWCQGQRSHPSTVHGLIIFTVTMILTITLTMPQSPYIED